ncbi:MAG TPA: DUF4202 domain-containing protein [Candidatus Acidoferrum sp.]|nr:DUF4202 domain-containing protein [Candidatus Acidoferrum sp.]
MAVELLFAHVSDPARFRSAIARFDELNSADPHRESVGGELRPRELVYAERLCEWIMRLAPQASEVLRLAARSQHLCRWEIPRDTYPQTRAGYHQWKNDLKKFHAGKSAEVLRAVGYTEDIISRVSDLNLKKHFPADAETRVLEDALCLMFLQFQFGELAAKLDDEKTVNAVRKSWEKMTDPARQHALALPYTDRERELIQRALG